MFIEVKSSVKLTNNFSHHVQSAQKSVQINISQKEKIFQSVTNLHKNSTIAVLNYLIPACYTFKQVWFGYSHMARQLGFCERTVQRAVHELHQLGLIQAQFRLMTSNLYSINPNIILYKQELRSKLSCLFSKSIGFSLLLLVGNVVPCEKKIYLSSHSNLTSVSIQGQGTKLIKKRREVMDLQSGKPKISPTLREITDKLQLTRHGQCKLLAFDDEVLSTVWKQGSDIVGELKNPVAWLIKHCVQESTAQSIKVDWDIYYLLIKRYNIPKSAPFQEKTQETKNKVVCRLESDLVYQQRLASKPNESQQRIQESLKSGKLTPGKVNYFLNLLSPEILEQVKNYEVS